MAKKVKKKTQSKAKNVDKQKRKSIILYWIAGIVILIPLLLLGYIYISTKEAAGKPTIGSRFDNSLDPAITDEQVTKVKDSLKLSGVDSVEVNLKSATLRITLDMKDTSSLEDVKKTVHNAYNKVNSILPVKTYFTNKKDVKMYDLDIHVYNFIPKDDSTKGWAYMEKTKNASAKKPVTDTISKARNKKVSDKLLKEQEGTSK